jgi:hypothetical protein
MKVLSVNWNRSSRNDYICRKTPDVTSVLYPGIKLNSSLHGGNVVRFHPANRRVMKTQPVSNRVTASYKRGSRTINFRV